MLLCADSNGFDLASSISANPAKLKTTSDFCITPIKDFILQISPLTNFCFSLINFDFFLSNIVT